MLQIERAIQEYLPILFLFLLDESPLDLLRPLQGYMLQERGMTVIVGEMDVTWVNPYRFGQVPTTPVKVGHPMPGAMRRSATYSVTTSTRPE